MSKRTITNAARRRTGILLGAVGMALNLLLFFLKGSAGKSAGSIAITADSFNNLSDVGSSALSLTGFLLSDMRRTRRYPYGWGRIEYLFGMGISGAILAVGIHLLLSSVCKILHPDPITPGLYPAIILLLAILIKSGMYAYNRRYGRALDSAVLRAAAVDSLCDCIATLAILLSMGLTAVFGINADGICGMMVALCILYAGIISLKDALSPLLGRGISDEYRRAIADIVYACGHIKSIERIEVHDYGPGARTADIELCGEVNLSRLKKTLYSRMGLYSVIEIHSHSSDKKIG